MRIYFCYLLIGLFIMVSCKKDEERNDNKITAEVANELIKDWVFDVFNPDMNPSFQFESVTEIHNDEIFEKLGGQVFSAQSEVSGLQNRWLFIKDEKVYDLHGFHFDQFAIETDANNLFVTDLNNDKTYELCYTANWGSYFIRNTVNCFYLSDEGNPSGVGVDIAINAYQNYYWFSLQKENEQQLILKCNDNSSSKSVGKLNLIEEEVTQLSVDVFNNVPQDILDILVL